MESFETYHTFLESLLIEEIIKDFDFNCKLNYVGKKRFGGSNITTYYFEDENGIKWERDICDREWLSIASKNPKMRARKWDLYDYNKRMRKNGLFNGQFLSLCKNIPK